MIMTEHDAVPPCEQNPIQVLQKKLDTEARRQVRERYFAWRIIPLLALWALAVALVKVVALDAISMGVALTIYFVGAAICVMWLSRQARQHSIER